MSVNIKNIFSLFIFMTICTVYARNIESDTVFRTIHNDNTKNTHCDSVKSFFEMRNITVRTIHKQNGVPSHHHHRVTAATTGSETNTAATTGSVVADSSGDGVGSVSGSGGGSTCGGICCGEKEEIALRLHVQQDFASLLRHNSRSLQGLLSTTATILHDHIMELTSQSENQTLHLFAQVYKRMAVLSREPIKALYSDIKKYLQISDKEEQTFAPSNLDIKTSVNRFFTDLFPLVYHHVINSHQQDFSFEYKLCLKQAINELQPFGDIPRQISTSAFKSLEATRVLLQAFAVGVEILNATDTLLLNEDENQAKNESNNSCHQALLKMTYCPKCRGLATHTKPCTGYCLNVLRGCLTQHVTELDSPWNDYVQAIERLVFAVKQHDAGVNVDAVIRSLDGKISAAIMYAMENGPSLEKKVKLKCGHAKLSNKEDSLITSDVYDPMDYDSNTSPEHIGTSLRTTPPDTQLLQFLSSVVKSRGFYATLADNLCKDEAFAETRDGRECWNGQRIGEYTETVVDASLSMQKYNPEVRPNYSSASGQIARLADKLRHVRQVVVSALGSADFPESDSYMQGDASEGSGSGIRKDSDDSDDDNLEGSGGSGDHHLGDSDHTGSTKKHSKPTKTHTIPTETLNVTVRNHYSYQLICILIFLITCMSQWWSIG